jgi:dihydroxyacetone kinase
MACESHALGGFGHLPLFLGYVGDGLCDGAAVGHVFSTPGANSVHLVTKETAILGRDVLYVIGNYLGDQLNFEMAAELAAQDGIKTRMAIISDDAASAPRSEWKSRRGIGGLVFALKVAGAAASQGKSLDECAELVERANESMATFGVAFTPCQLPGTSAPVFSISEGEMEIGIGIHGEPGVRRAKIMPSEEIAEMALELLVEDLSLARGSEAAVLVNGLGATPKEELHILYKDIRQGLRSRGIKPALALVGEYATSLEMNGVSVTLMKLDSDLKKMLSEPAHSPFVHFQGALLQNVN